MFWLMFQEATPALFESLVQPYGQQRGVGTVVLHIFYQEKKTAKSDETLNVKYEGGKQNQDGTKIFVLSKWKKFVFEYVNLEIQPVIKVEIVSKQLHLTQKFGVGG